MSVATRTDWRALASRMRGDLDRADLTGRARRLAEFAIKATLMAGRVRVVIPNRMELCRLLNIGKNHVAEVIAALESSRILSVTESADGWELLVFPDSSQWMVEWIYTREGMAAFLAIVNRAPGQCQGELIDPGPNLNRTLAEVSAENASSHFGNHGKPEKQAFSGQPSSAPFKVSNSKESNPFRFETLKGAALAIGGNDEGQAVAGVRQVLGEAVADRDGGKWRVRWRNHREKVRRVFAAAVEDSGLMKVRNMGAHTEFLWKTFAD